MIIWLVYLGLFQLIFESLGNSSDSSRKQIFKDILGFFSYFFQEKVCFSIESPRRCDSNEQTEHTIIEKKFHLCPNLAL